MELMSRDFVGIYELKMSLIPVVDLRPSPWGTREATSVGKKFCFHPFYLFFTFFFFEKFGISGLTEPLDTPPQYTMVFFVGGFSFIVQGSTFLIMAELDFFGG